ncbi:MAG: flagellar hook-length control protein FliK [Lachnospiraceae bacterium]|nr:flagellar hook-length control protein FliK [Lachnospiraceae bacterium]
MSGAPVQGMDAFTGMIQVQNAQMQGGRALNRDVDGAQAPGEFGKLIEKATEVLEAAKTGQAMAFGASGDVKSADLPVAAAAKTADRQGSTADRNNMTAADDKKDAVKQSGSGDDTANVKEPVNEKQAVKSDDNARVTDDEGEKDLQSAADDAGRNIMSEIAVKLDVSIEDIETAMETLGLSAVQLLDPANLTALVMEVTGESDPMVFITDADLYSDLKEILAFAQGETEELGITPEQIEELTAVNVDAESMEEAGAIPADEQEAVGRAKDEPADFKITKTDSEGNTETVEVTVTDGGNVVAENVQKTQSQNDDGGRESRRDRREHGNTAEEHNAAETVISQIAGRMNEAQAAFNEAMPVEQTPEARQQQMVDIVRQITEQIRVDMSSDVTSMELTLHPASLGNVHITVAQDAQGRMVAQFVVENETVRQAVESQLSTLQQRLDEQGIRVEAVEVTVGGRTLDNGTGGQQTGEEADRRRDEGIRAQGPRGTRRINLGEEDEENADEETKLAAEMMAANGNSVDYTA